MECLLHCRRWNFLLSPQLLQLLQQFYLVISGSFCLVFSVTYYIAEQRCCSSVVGVVVQGCC